VYNNINNKTSFTYTEKEHFSYTSEKNKTLTKSAIAKLLVVLKSALARLLFVFWCLVKSEKAKQRRQHGAMVVIGDDGGRAVTQERNQDMMA